MFIPKFIQDPFTRRQVGFSRLNLERFQLCIARTSTDYEEAFRLVHVGHVFQGAEQLGPLGMRITEQHVLPEATVINAREEGQLIGTLTITEDSPVGLCLGSDYPNELTQLRDGGARLVEVGSVAIVRRCWRSDAVPLLSLFGFRHAIRHTNATHFVIGVNPTMVDYYRALWGFQVIASPKRRAKLAAPVVALAVSLEVMKEHCHKYFTKAMRSGPSLCNYLFDDAAWPWPDDMPKNLSPQSRARWKMPRSVFRDLFLERTDRVSSLSLETQDHLRCRRTDATVQAKIADAMPTPVAAPSAVRRPALRCTTRSKRLGISSARTDADLTDGASL